MRCQIGEKFSNFDENSGESALDFWFGERNTAEKVGFVWAIGMLSFSPNRYFKYVGDLIWNFASATK